MDANRKPYLRGKPYTYRIITERGAKMKNREANNTTNRLVLDCDPGIDVEEILKKFADQESKCKVRTAATAMAMVESGAAKSERQAAEKICKETGEPVEAVRTRIKRGKKTLGSTEPTKTEPDSLLTDDEKQVAENGELPPEQETDGDPRDRLKTKQSKNVGSNVTPPEKKKSQPECIEPSPQHPEMVSGAVDDTMDDPGKQAEAVISQADIEAQSHGEVLQKMAIKLESIKNEVEKKGLVPDGITEDMLQDIKYKIEHLRSTIEGIAKYKNIPWM
jgi:hypothetical protein